MSVTSHSIYIAIALYTSNIQNYTMPLRDESMGYLKNAMIASLYTANIQWQCIVLHYFNVMMTIYGLYTAKKSINCQNQHWKQDITRIWTL